MSDWPRSLCHFILVSLLFLSRVFAVENGASLPANSDPTYQAIRSVTVGTEAVTVNNFTLVRDSATFHLHSGVVCFVTPVQGKVTGAVFVGDGNMILTPPTSIESASLKLLTKEDEFAEKFSQLVLRFTDATYAELKKAGTSSSNGCDSGLLRDSQNAMRHNNQLKFNLDARIFADVMSPEPGGLFVAFIHGRRYNDKEIFAIDPHGAPPLLSNLAPEEVEFVTYSDDKLGVWAAFHLGEEYKNGTATNSQANSVIHIEHQTLQTTIEKNATLTGKATTTFVSRTNGLRVVPFDLFPTLRVQTVSSQEGQFLSFIQESKDEDAEFFSVILPRPLATGERYTLVSTYSGKDAVRSEGEGNYFPIARHNWYPNNAGAVLGEYTAYDLTFLIPRGMRMAATGTLVSETNGDQNTTVWKSEVPQTVAGFNFGRFKEEKASIEKPAYLLESFANENPPDWVQQLKHAADPPMTLSGSHMSLGSTLGTMNTTTLMKKALAEAELSIQIYSDYFGPLPYKHLAMTQQTACNFGQSWPTLVWLPICSYYDSTVRHQLGLDHGDRGYWKIVAPHEVAHQWWGHDVGFNSYRDQWISEGFAEFSASLFLQVVQKNPKAFTDFWDDERDMLTERNKMGYRAIDAGPLTLGHRLDNSRTGFNIARSLIYPKGAYILHMIRMMMWDRKTEDQAFKDMMRDFVKTYAGRSATTEDFQAMVEKHATAEMKSVAKGKMDWFFDEYVYGTALPSYHFQYSFDSNANNETVFSFRLTQSDVDEHFHMLVPIYFELADGSVHFLGRARVSGNSSLERKISLAGMKDRPRRALLNYHDDVLCLTN